MYTSNEAGGIWRGGLWDVEKVLQMLDSQRKTGPDPFGVEESISRHQQWDSGNWEIVASRGKCAYGIVGTEAGLL